MSATLLERLDRELGELRLLSRYRSPRGAAGVDFSSNDYLGFSRHPALAAAVRGALGRVPVGSGGSRLLRGHHPEHEALEREAAGFLGSEAALYFNSGFDANLALLSSLPSRRDAVVLDERVHASAKEGARAGFARKLSARHNDLQSFEDATLRARRAGAREVFLVVESYYGMDADRAPLEGLLDLSRRHDAMLVVDEAHAVGALGPRGRGLAAGLPQGRLIRMAACGKALGCSGALVAAPRPVVEYLVNAARPFLYSTAASPLIAAAVRRALALVDEEPERRERLAALAARARARLPAAGEGHLLPVLAGTEAEALRLASLLQARGLDARAVRPPTVPAGASRLRVSLSCERTEAELDLLADALEEARRG